MEECTNSPFELLGDPIISNGTTSGDSDSTIYTRAYRVDDNGRSMLIALARSHGSCGTCSGDSESDSTPILRKGFRAEITGTVVALSSDGVPVQVQISDAKRSNDQGTVCGLTRVTPAPAPMDVDNNEKENESSKQSNDTGVTVLSVIVVVMASSLAVMSLYFGVLGGSNASKSTIK